MLPELLPSSMPFPFQKHLTVLCCGLLYHIFAAGPGAKGRSGSSKQIRQKHPPMMVHVGTTPDSDPNDSSAAAGGLLDSLGPDSTSNSKSAADSSGAFRGPASPWQQEKRLIGKAEARGQMEAKACGCASFNFDFICGMDGLTYANPCMAQCAGTQVSYTGPCEATWSALPKSSTVKRVTIRDSSSSSDEGLYQDELVLDQRAAGFESEARYNGDYEYYYDDGRAPVPAPPRRQTPGAAPAPLPAPVPIPVNPLRPPPAVVEDGKHSSPALYACRQH